MPGDELHVLERMAGELRVAVAGADWERAAEVDRRLHEALVGALGTDAGTPSDGAATAAALGRIMRVYESAMRDALRARDGVGKELAGIRAGQRAAAGYLSAAGS